MGLTHAEVEELAVFMAALQEATNDAGKIQFDGVITIFDSNDDRCGNVGRHTTGTDWEYSGIR